MQKAIAYYRVSTEEQGKSGLSLEAQQKAVSDFANANDYDLIEEFIEVRSSRSNMHFALKAALNECKQCGAVLLIAKLDRLSRNVAFIATLMDAKDVTFTVVDNPHADKIILHIMAVFAQYEREQTSRRTSAALQAAKSKGVELGKNGKYVLAPLNRNNAIAFARKMKPIIERYKERGIKTVRAITKELNKQKVRSYRNGKWHPSVVYNLMQKIKTI